MTDKGVLDSYESRLYRRATSDGMIDLFFGVCLVFLGAAWVGLGRFPVLAVVLPAVFVPVAIPARSRFVELRLGYVKWSESRRTTEQHDRIGWLAVGALLFLVAAAVYVLVLRSAASIGVLEAIAPGIVAWLVAVLALGLAYVMRARRFAAYAVALAAAGAATAVQDANPGWALLVCGIAVAVTGLWMLIRFVRRNPIPRGV